jgi:hypothetical protein
MNGPSDKIVAAATIGSTLRVSNAAKGVCPLIAEFVHDKGGD